MKKLLSMLICISLVFSICVPAMAADDDIVKYAELHAYGILEGDETGNINLVENITRAEFCKMIFKAMAMDDSYAAQSASDFDDVPKTHWAYKYIDFAKSNGFVNGVGDNKFEPDSEIITQDMLKIAVSVLGFSEFAKQLGGYPEGYVITAVKWGIPTNKNSIATQEIVTRAAAADIIYNMLAIPLCVERVNGDNTEYVILDGTNGLELRTLKTVLDEKNK